MTFSYDTIINPWINSWDISHTATGYLISYFKLHTHATNNGSIRKNEETRDKIDERNEVRCDQDAYESPLQKSTQWLIFL